MSTPENALLYKVLFANERCVRIRNGDCVIVVVVHGIVRYQIGLAYVTVKILELDAEIVFVYVVAVDYAICKSLCRDASLRLLCISLPSMTFDFVDEIKSRTGYCRG